MFMKYKILCGEDLATECLLEGEDINFVSTKANNQNEGNDHKILEFQINTFSKFFNKNQQVFNQVFDTLSSFISPDSPTKVEAYFYSETMQEYMLIYKENSVSTFSLSTRFDEDFNTYPEKIVSTLTFGVNYSNTNNPGSIE